MTSTVLITGGAGFIGAHVARDLLADSWNVRALDDLVDQVHEDARPPAYLPADVDLRVGDVRDRDAVARALDGVDAVVHLAARVGVGQSMYQIDEYTSVNTAGTATLLQELIERPVQRLVVASSMSVYGEGRYTPVPALPRTRAQLERHEWDPRGAGGETLEPLPTDEDKAPDLSSVYALNKFDQEQMCLLYGSAYGTPVTALRFFNVYGRHQALSNPYTGVLAIFASRLLNGRAPMIFEDGGQRRDFVSVSDVARACRLALEREGADGLVANVGSGQSVTVAEIAAGLARVMGREDIVAERTGTFRVGDIRHCFADIGRAEARLGYLPQVDLETGMLDLAEWLAGEVAVDRVEEATAQLTARGLAA